MRSVAQLIEALLAGETIVVQDDATYGTIVKAMIEHGHLIRHRGAERWELDRGCDQDRARRIGEGAQ